MHNFGQIKQVYNTILAETVASKDKSNKTIFAKYVKALKENEALKTQFMVYNNIESKVEENDYKASEFIKANISLLDKFDKTELAEANEKLADEVMLEHESSANEELQKLHENINTLIFTEKSPTTVNAIVEATSEIVEYIKSNKPKVVTEASELPPSLFAAICVDRFNSEYENLDESTLKLVKTILESDEEGRKEFFNEIKKECIVLVNNKLNEGEEKEKLLAVKEKLLDMSFVVESHIDDMTSLIELKETLSE